MNRYGLALQRYQVIIVSVTIILFWLVWLARAVAAPSQQGQDIAMITSPASNAVVSGVVEIIGSADHPSFEFYKVEFAPEPISGDQWQVIGELRQSPVIDGVLERWDTTLVPDGSYTLRLRVVRFDGNYGEDSSQQVVVSNSQPTPTPTLSGPEATPIPTVTPTDLPPTATVVVEQPIVDTATPRPTETPVPLPDPDEGNSLIPTVSGFSVSPLQDACLFGAGVMFSIFLLFAFLAALRTFILGFIHQWQRKSR